MTKNFCVVCKTEFVVNSATVCEKCRGKGWIDPAYEKRKSQKQIFQDAKECLGKLVSCYVK